ncbi:MAG: hypothetical protein IJV00_00220 [Clostridia bacterium]|nr:hypothetical protein [Clostridia bacterium]
MATVRDKLWMFGVRPHQDDIWFRKSTEDRVRFRSRITPGEAALMLDVPNVMMINCEGEPVPFSEDAYGYAESFVSMDNVLWGATGSGGFRIGNEEKFICKLAEEYPNIRGAFCDDLLGSGSKLSYEERKNKHLKIVSDIRNGLDQACRPMEIHAVYYIHKADSIAPEVLEKIDVLSLWTWFSEELDHIEDSFGKFERYCPEHRKMIGIYMFDFDAGKSVTVERMEHQCEFALKMLKEKRIEGMIIETNSVMGIGLPSELWLRGWIRKVKNDVIPD